MRETTATAMLKRIGKELKRSHEGVQITFLPLGDGRSVVSFDPVPVSFKLEVARQMKIDPATFIKPIAKRARKRHLIARTVSRAVRSS